MTSRRTRSSRVDQGRDDDGDVAGWSRWHRSVLQRLGWGARDAVAVSAAGCAATAIVANALFLQSGPHPAPFFKPSLPLAARGETTSAVAVPRPRPAEPARPKIETPTIPRTPGEAAKTPRPPAAVPVRNDAIGDLLAPSNRVAAVQRALAQFGYGQIKPTGVVDTETRAAIEKFERDRKLPVTGQPSDRLTRELAAATGRPLD